VFLAAHSANMANPGQSILMMMQMQQIFEPSFLGRAIFPDDAS
jgi:hypothetical protein